MAIKLGINLPQTNVTPQKANLDGKETKEAKDVSNNGVKKVTAQAHVDNESDIKEPGDYTINVTFSGTTPESAQYYVTYMDRDGKIHRVPIPNPDVMQGVDNFFG